MRLKRQAILIQPTKVEVMDATWQTMATKIFHCDQRTAEGEFIRRLDSL